MNKTLVFTATYNESENIKKFIEEVFKINHNLDLLIIDDNSPDKTSNIVKILSKNNKNIKLITRDSKLGLNTAHISAYEYAVKNKYDKLITLDADLSHDPNEITKIIGLLDKYDFVIGSRYIRGGKNTQPVFRYLISYLGNRLIKLILKINLNEFTTSYRGFNIKKLNNFNLNQIKGKGYSFFMETIIVLNRLGYKCFEFPIQFKDRVYGKSKIPKIEIFRTFKNLILLFLKK